MISGVVRDCPAVPENQRIYGFDQNVEMYAYVRYLRRWWQGQWKLGNLHRASQQDSFPSFEQLQAFCIPEAKNENEFKRRRVYVPS